MRWNSEERRRYGEVADEGGESDSGYGCTNLPDISPNADWMQRGWVNYAGSSGLPFNQVVTTMPPHARGWNESWEEEEEVQQDEDPPGLHEVGQLHARIRMVRLEDEEEEEHEAEEEEAELARGSQDPQPVQGPDDSPVVERRTFNSVAAFLGRQQDQQGGEVESNETYSTSHRKPQRTMVVWKEAMSMIGIICI